MWYYKQYMNKLEKYKKEFKLINIAIEAVIVFVMYLLASVIRLVVQVGMKYAFSDSIQFMGIGVAFTVTIIIVTYYTGAYFTFHVDDKAKELKNVLISTMVGIAMDCVIIYLFRLEQFSRLLLFYFAVLSCIAIYIKRIILSNFVKRYDEKYQITSNVLLIGAGTSAQLIYDTILKTKQKNLSLFGYLAEETNENIPDYLGDPSVIRDVISDGNISVIIIADENISRERIKDIVVLATNHNIRVTTVPGFSDFLPSKNAVTQIAGNYLFELTALDTCDIMGVNISVTNMEKTLKKIKDNLEAWSGKYICVSNVHTTVTASEDNEYKSIQNKAVIALPDGGPLSKFSREHGYNGASRVTGPDLMRRILIESSNYGWKHYFYGSTQETLDKLKLTIEEKYPGTCICGMYSPPFRPLTVQEDNQVIDEINNVNPDFIWVGLGAPKQEVWMAAHEDKVKGLMIGVGAAFDYECGNIRRAPMWMQKLNLEWLFRLIQDPKRLFSRYLKTNTKYIIWKYMNGGKDN